MMHTLNIEELAQEIRRVDGPIAAEGGAWEKPFCDDAYFGMWCVRRKNSRKCGEGFHVSSRDEAEALHAALTHPAPSPNAIEVREVTGTSDNPANPPDAVGLELLHALADEWQSGFEEDESTGVEPLAVEVQRIYVRQLRAALAQLEGRT